MKNIVYILLSFMLPSAMFGQLFIKNAHKQYVNYNYPKVIHMLGDHANLPTQSNRELAESYKKMGDYAKAEVRYAKVIMANDKTAADVYAYAQILKINQKYADAKTQMSVYAQMNPSDSRVGLYNKNTNYISELLKDKHQFELKNLNMNSEEQEFGAVYYKDQIIFASTYHKVGPTWHSWNSNELHFLNNYSGKISPNGEIIDTKPFKQLNKRYHDGAVTVSSDNKTLYYSRENYKKRSKEGIRNLEIYEAKLNNDELEENTPFAFNDKEYSVTHPALSADGNTLYFASDMPGGKGGSDLYRVRKNLDGTWGAAENLGDKINTEGNEVFPFINDKNILFFSSDGHPGLGGLDVFAVQITKDNHSRLINPGVPLNSNKDDFSFIVNSEGKNGYISSNRDGGKGNDDIYSFNMYKPFVFGKVLKGISKDKDGNALALVDVNLLDSNGVVVKTVQTKEDGSYSFDVEENSTYKLKGTKEKYFDGITPVSTNVKQEVITANVELEKNPGVMIVALVTDHKTGTPLEGVKMIITDVMTNTTETFVTSANGQYLRELPEKHINDFLNYDIYIEKGDYLKKHFNYSKTITKPGVYNIHETLDLNMTKVEVGVDIAKAINLSPIYFDLAKWTIRTDAATELEKIISVMNEYPNMVVELGSHTDCRGGQSANMKLSDKRAKSSAEYIKKHITNPERISGKGYGESKLINGCACEGPLQSTCSEEEHQQNRRTEFIIVKMK